MSAAKDAPDVDLGHSYVIEIGWAGAQDKPYYRATFVSPDRAPPGAAEPFHEVAVISNAEAVRLLQALERKGVTLEPSHDAGLVDEYRVEVVSNGDRRSASLGAGDVAAEGLAALADALDGAHRRLLDNLLRRVARSELSGSSPSPLGES